MCRRKLQFLGKARQVRRKILHVIRTGRIRGLPDVAIVDRQAAVMPAEGPQLPQPVEVIASEPVQENQGISLALFGIVQLGPRELANGHAEFPW